MHSILEQSEGPYLEVIFEKNSEGYYTDDALLYQDTLLYSLEEKKNQHGPDTFVFNDLAGWLVMKKSLEFTRYYSGKKAKTNKYSRINAKRRRIQKRVDVLQDMFLLYEVKKVPARKNSLPTPLYWYFDYGKILARIIKIMGLGKTTSERKGANEEIYRLLQSELSLMGRWEWGQMSRFQFKRAFFERCWQNGIFGNIVDTVIAILHQRPKVRNLSKVFDSVVYDYVRFTNQEMRRKVWKSFVEALNGLDETTRNIVIYYEKLELERRIYESYEVQSDYKASRKWEEAWFENRNDYAVLVLLVFCNNCEYKGPGIVDYYEFKREAVMLDNGKLVIETADCPNCKDNGDIIVSV